MHQVIHGYLMELRIAPDVKQVGSSLVVDVSDILAIKVRAQRTHFIHANGQHHRNSCLALIKVLIMKRNLGKMQTITVLRYGLEQPWQFFQIVLPIVCHFNDDLLHRKTLDRTH